MDAMEWSICPVCDSAVPSLELERHADNHFRDEELAREIEFAQQIELAFCNSTPDQVNNGESRDTKRQGPESSSAKGGNAGNSPVDSVDEKLCYLVSSQIRDTFYKVQTGLITLLRNCLILDCDDSTSILSGYVDHFWSIESEDAGWGCGWRNIQMLSSHLLRQRQESRQVLFGGCGFVPDIASLQRWLELAWERGFDELGSEHFDHKIYGKKNWIGTTECAALLRCFGLHARIVDFDSKEGIVSKSSALSSCFEERGVDMHGRNKTTIKVLGPMDKFFIREDDNHNNPQASSSGKKFPTIENMRGHQVLVDWVWNYFSENKPCSSGTRCVISSEKAPLYFQHDGHSRTIVGIQVKHQKKGMQQFNLLILDPSHRTEALESSLKVNNGWQKLIKRGVHTLKKPQYQLCYVDPGIACGKELEKLKILDSIYYRF